MSFFEVLICKRSPNLFNLVEVVSQFAVEDHILDVNVNLRISLNVGYYCF